MKIELNKLSEVKGIGKKTIQRIREYKLTDEGYISEYDKSLHLNRNSVNQGDCLELMNGIKDKSIDMILADLPYGTTACNWDSIINLDKLWLQYERVIKDNGAIVLTASQPFTTKLINSNIGIFKYGWVWEKNAGSNFGCMDYQPMKEHEDILIFGKGKTKYNPIMEDRKGAGKNRVKYNVNYNTNAEVYRDSSLKNKKTSKRPNKRYPSSIQKFNRERGLHPTQKPVALFEYLIKTYTNEGDLVLDNVAGSGTTGAACQNTNRDYILIEQEVEYVDVIRDRLS